MSDLKTLFADPPARYRGAPFWSWNDRLEVEELVRQVHDMKAHGMGAFFMHSREGLETEYMSADWLECIRETVRAAKQASTYAWLYDEDRWPSGAAGGLVPARGGDAYRAKAVTIELAETYEPDDDTLALFSARLDGERLREARRIAVDGRAQAAEGEVLLVLRRVVASPSEWFNDDAPADNLNPGAVAAFVDITYEAYRREIGGEFGATVPGMFTDEPNFGLEQIAGDLPRLPWTEGLDVFFCERRGYDLLDVLPHVFLDSNGSAKARHDYWWTISECFTEAYTKQIYEWCEAQGLGLTGHYLLENTMGDATVSAGSMMPHYRYQHVPGIDMLTIQTHENLTVKQCSSVAHQFGREYVLSELYGCAGWEMTFEDQKWSGDWQYVLGVNLRCQHLTLYSLRGCRKRDYPPSFNYNSPWWKYNGIVEDYFARVGLLTSQGRAVRDVLVLHPQSTAWTMVAHGRRLTPSVARANRFGETINDFTRAVLAAHYDFDFGDEQIMAREAHLEGNELVVGQAAYKVVVVPPGTRTLFRSTIELLHDLLDAGGTLIAFDPPPDLVEGAEDEAASALLARSEVTLLADACALQAALEDAVPRRVSICDRCGQEVSSILYLQRKTGTRDCFFLVNGDRNNGHRVRIGFKGVGRLEEWDALSGEIHGVPVQVREESVWFETSLAPAGSKLYVLDRDLPPQTLDVPVGLGAAPPIPDALGPIRLPCESYVGPVCRFKRTEPNALPLDVCEYKVGESEFSEPMPVWQAQRAVRETLGMRPVYYNGLPQRYKWAGQPHPEDGTQAAFQFSFEVRAVPATPVYLLLERASEFEITLNGASVPNMVEGWWLDRSFHKVLLPALRQGTNVLTLTCAYRNDMEMEDVYVLGDFAVTVGHGAVARAIVREPETLRFGDWCLQGYLHYPGSMIYLKTLTYKPAAGERLLLALSEHRAVTVAVHVNDAVVGHIPWQAANGFDLAPHLRPGENELGIEVMGSPRNMLGPLHRRRGRERGTSWASFRTEGVEYTPEYVLEPYGLFEQVRIVRAPR